MHALLIYMQNPNTFSLVIYCWTYWIQYTCPKKFSVLLYYLHIKIVDAVAKIGSFAVFLILGTLQGFDVWFKTFLGGAETVGGGGGSGEGGGRRDQRSFRVTILEHSRPTFPENHH